MTKTKENGKLIYSKQYQNLNNESAPQRKKIRWECISLKGLKDKMINERVINFLEFKTLGHPKIKLGENVSILKEL
jgi:hypothetical protein